MASTYTVNLGIEKIGTGEQSGTWGNTTNTNFDLIDQAVNGAVTVTLASAGTSGSPNSLVITNGAASDGRNKFIEFNDGGDLGATAYVQLDPNDAEKIVHMRNSLSGGRSVIVFQGTYNASNDFEIPNGKDVVLKFDGAGASATVTDVFTDLQTTGLTVTGTTSLAGASTTADITFGDNDKAVFGAGSDLQIYHDGSASYIDDAGTGNLRIRANSSLSIQKYTGETMGVFTADGSVLLAHDNATKFETTATGIDVTGTVTADGLTVDGSGLIQSSTGGVLTLKSTDTAASTSSVLGQINFYNSDSSGSSPNNAVIIKSTGQSGGGNGDLEFKVTNSGIEGNDALTSLRIDDAGDISFYEDTGTTPKFFWDASAEALGIGTTSPQEPLSVESSGQRKILATNTDFASGTTGSSFDIGFGATSGNTYTDLRALISGRSAWGDLVLQRGGGNVGIGTTSPSYKTTVEGENEGAALTLAALHNTGTTAGSEARLILAGGNGLTTRHAYISAINGGSAGGNAHALTFATNAAAASPQEAMRITSAGDVGIGTSSPATPLEVQTSTDNSAYIRVGTSSNGGHTIGDDIAALEFYGADASGSGAGVKGSIRYQYGSTSGATTHMAFAVADVSGSNDVERMRIDSSGNVGIGTTSPDTLMELRAANPVLTIRDTETSTASNDARVRLAETGVSDALGNYYDIGYIQGNLQFRYNTSEYMRLDDSGNLLVGTTSVTNTSPSVQANPLGDFKVVNGFGNGVGENIFLNRQSGTGDFILFRYTNSTVGSISTNGSTTAYNTSSDARLKENIAEAESASELIDAIQVRSFDWIADGSHQRYGMVAQELLEVAPEAVSGDPESDDMMGVDYSKLVPMLVKEIQSLRARVAQLEGA